ncbi:MAG: DUF1592 domain-containing protein [Myxococcota bacterium]
MSTGCYTGIQELNGGVASGGEGGADDGGDDDGEGPDGLGPEEELPVPTTRFFRLTHVQWENTVQDLFDLDEPSGLSADFRADAREGGFLFDNNATSLEVDEALWSGYQRAAVDMAEIAASDPSILEFIAPDTGDETTRAAEFIRNFGRRAFRRPLTDAEATQYVELFNRGPELYEETTGFAAGVRLVLEAILQSPNFLYRSETSEEIVDGVIPLNSWEVASRISYFLLDTMPDDELLDLAEAGELEDPDRVQEQARRLLENPRAHMVVQKFHHTLLEVEKFQQTAPSPAFYPDAPENLGDLAVQEHDLFLAHTVFDNDGSWGDLLTSTETYVNADLAAIYGLSGDFGDEFTRVDLDPNERRGLFTQIGFLVANATSVHPDPIHRGAYLARHIACHSIAAPPDTVPPVPEGDPDATNRETVIAHTEAPGTECLGCHKPLINPFGFPYENYDSTGAFRTEDNGQTVDASATVALASGAVEVSNAVDLAEAMATDEQVHQCYLEHWTEYTMGRPYDDLDEALVDRLATASVEDASVKELLVEFATSRPFLTRSTEEMQ